MRTTIITETHNITIDSDRIVSIQLGILHDKPTTLK
jgi:hypothetical protein